jgi:Cu/Ag efflux pump CusA
VAMVWAFVLIYRQCSSTQLAIEAYPNNPDTSSQAIAQAPGVAAEEG